MQKEFENIVFEFAKRVSGIGAVQTIILFGSVAKGEADKRSDIDILVVFDSQKPLRDIREKSEVSKIALDLEKEFDISIQLVFSNKNFEKLDRQFIENIFNEGIIIYGKTPQVDVKQLKLEPYSLVYFSLNKLDKPDKMRLRRILYGHETEKEYKGKIYKSKFVGLIDQLEGTRTGIASVIVPAKKSKILIDTLKQFKAEYKKTDVWISEV